MIERYREREREREREWEEEREWERQAVGYKALKKEQIKGRKQISILQYYYTEFNRKVCL